MKHALKLIGSLTAICLISGALLAFVYEATAERIEAVAQMRIAAAAAQVLPTHDRIDDEIEIQHENSVFLFRPAYREDDILVGYAIQFATQAGYGGEIRMMLGLDTNGMTTGLAILPGHTETPGLGAKITESSFLQSFRNKPIAATNWRVAKDGGEIDEITAATISSRAVADAVNSVSKVFKEHQAMLTGGQ